MKAYWWASGLALLCSTAAQATPGLGEEVYGAEASAGRTEFEVSYARLAGGPASGDSTVQLEATHHVNDRLRLAAFGEFSGVSGGPRRAEEVGIEAIYSLGNTGGIAWAIYGEYALGLNGNADVLESKLIAEHRRGPFDARLDLSVEKPLAAHSPAELNYAFAADYAVGGEFRLGVEAFGDLGTFRDLAPRAEHFIGPRAAVEIEGLGPELELTAGYLIAVGAARDNTKGQFHLALEMEF